MSDELKKSLVEFFTLMLNNIKSGAEWGKEQIPLIIQEKLTWSLIDWSLWLTFWTLLGLILIYLSKKFQKASENKNIPSYEQENYSFASWLLFIASLVPLILFNLVVLNNMAYIYFAPRLFIIDWLSSLIN